MAIVLGKLCFKFAFTGKKHRTPAGRMIRFAKRIFIITASPPTARRVADGGKFIVQPFLLYFFFLFHLDRKGFSVSQDTDRILYLTDIIHVDHDALHQNQEACIHLLLNT